MVAGVKVKPPPETRRCSSAGGGSQRRRGGMILSYLSTCTQTYCLNSASTSSSNIPKFRQFQSTPALKPTLIHITKCNQELRSRSSFCHMVLPFLHFFPLSISSLSFARISIISYWSVSRGEKPTPTSIFRHTAKSSNTTWNMGVDSLRCWQKWLIWSQQIKDGVCKISFLMFSQREMQEKKQLIKKNHEGQPKIRLTFWRQTLFCWQQRTQTADVVGRYVDSLFFFERRISHFSWNAPILPVKHC